MGPIHPALVHFPIVLTLVSVAVDLYGAATKSPVARVVGFWSLVAATLGANVAVIAGLYDMEKAVGHVDLVHVHMWLGLALLAVLFAATLWRFRLHRRAGGIGAYAFVAPIFALGIIVQGWLGGELVFANGVGVAVKGEAASGHDHGATSTATPEGAARRSVGEGEHEAGGHAHGATPSMDTAPASSPRAAKKAGAPHEGHDASGGTSAPASPNRSNERGAHTQHEASASPGEGGEVERAATNAHGGHAATMSPSPTTAPQRTSGASDTAVPPTTKATDTRTSPSMVTPSEGPPAMSISGAHWPDASTARRAPRAASHPASPRAPSPPSYGPPASLSSAPLLTLDDAGSPPQEAMEGAADDDGMEHQP